MKRDFEMLNEISVDLSRYDAEELSYFERKRIKKRISRKLGKKSPLPRIAVVAVLCGSLLWLPAIQSDVRAAFYGLASSIPAVRGMLDLFVGQPEQRLAEYKTTVGQTVSDNGIDVRLDEVLIDTGRLIISSTFHSDKINLEDALSPFPSVYINGKDVMKNGGGGNGNKAKIDDNTYSFISSVNLNGTTIEGDLEIRIVYKDLDFAGNEPAHKGNWGFTLHTSAEKLLGDTRTIAIDRSFSLDNGQQIRIEAMELSPISTTIHYHILNGKDLDVLFQVTGSDGSRLIPVSAVTMSQNSHIRFSKLPEDLPSLTVVPYVISGEEGSKQPKEKTFLEKESFEVKIK
ncbi:DUF4179 domain-containing protein [Paenibacillus sp. OAS669]|uniref:DUF4179 domain-containing protein n=1 Tax=Paenibacillus sp. OAS669 TaxID=2663821 RepID=UPI00178A4915|nr:DUF4179 domain-containing protein [Paenibacillus sp. OAS669]MBE1446754.1 hypothetical protein [Paenibacillus sp. OAS669]